MTSPSRVLPRDFAPLALPVPFVPPTNKRSLPPQEDPQNTQSPESKRIKGPPSPFEDPVLQELMSQIDKLWEKNNALRKTNGDANWRIFALENQVLQLIHDNRELSQQTSAARIRNLELENQMDWYRYENTKLHQDLNQKNAQIAQSQETIDEISRVNQEYYQEMLRLQHAAQVNKK